MNERIRELAKEAVRGIHTDFYIPDVFKEKFAELIVRECASIDFYNLPGFGLYHEDCAHQAIKKHFGIEK